MHSSITTAAAALLMAAGSATAAVITFGNTAGVDLLGTTNSAVRTEAGFSYQAFGTGWELTPGFQSFGNPGSALATVYNNDNAQVGGRVDIYASTPGQQFVFGSIDWRTGSGAQFANHDVVIEGFLGASLIGSISLTGASQSYQTASGFAGTIDLLRIRVTDANGSGMGLDNIVLNAPLTVPEPATLVLGGLALAGAGFATRARRATR